MNASEKADHIMRLRKRIDKLAEKDKELNKEYQEKRLPYHYMMALVEIIRDHSGLLYGWRHVLNVAEIEEPEWKHEYTTKTV